MFLHDASKPFALFALLAVGLAVAVGCQRNNGRKDIAGTVTLDGQPVVDAVVHFQPSSGQTGNSSGAATDAKGRFNIASVKGLLPGNYAVNIQKWEGTGRTAVDPETRKPVEITAPIRFKEDGKLEAKITQEGPNQFEFRLTRVK